MNRPWTERFNAFLFAPLHDGWFRAFRLLFAAAFAVVFESRRQMPILELVDHARWGGLYEQVFLRPEYGWCLLPLLMAWGFGFRTRIVGALLVLACLPLVFVQGRFMSRQIMLTCLFALSLSRACASGGRGPLWPIRLVQIQLSLVYLVNALAKSTPAYLSGDLLAGMSRVFSNFTVDLSSGFLVAAGWHIPVAACAAATVLMEYALAIGFWIPRLRIPLAVLGALFHLALQQVVRIGMLDYTCVFLYLVFLIPWQARGDDAFRTR